ncbi:MAG: TMEM175 family protein, partial [Chitinophagaceae bacterium]
IITIMVLEMKVPHGTSLASLKPLLPVFISYILSFIYLSIYWNNHHHMLHAARQVNGKTLWANIHLLFWLSLIPFVTGWMGENNFATLPVVFYGIVLLMAAVAYYILAHSLAGLHGKNSTLAEAFGKDWKGLASIFIYAAGIGLSFIHPWLGFAMYVFVAGIWFIPDKRIEKRMVNEKVP